MASNNESNKAAGVRQAGASASEMESRYLSQQITSMFDRLGRQIESLRKEFDYLTQQSASTYNRLQREVSGAQAALTQEIRAVSTSGQAEEENAGPDFEVIVDHERIVDDVVQGLSEKLQGQDETDYDYISSKVADAVLGADTSDLVAQVADRVTEQLLAGNEEFVNAIANAVYEKLHENEATEETVVVDETEAVPEENVQETDVVSEEVEPEEEKEAVDYDVLADTIVGRMDMASLAVDVASRVEVPAAAPVEIDYRYLADLIVENLADKITLPDMEIDATALAEDIAGKVQVPAVDEQAVAGAILEALPEVDYDTLSANIVEKVTPMLPDPAVDTEAVADAVIDKLTPMLPEVDAQAIAGEIVEALPEVDYDTLSATVLEKVAPMLPDPAASGEEIANAVVEKLTAATEEETEEVEEEAEPLIDYDYLCEKVAEKVKESMPTSEVEEVSRRVIEKIGVLQAVADCDEIADRVIERLNGGEAELKEFLAQEGIEATDETDRVISAVEENSGKTNALVEEVLELLKQRQFVAAVPVPAPVEEEEPAEEPVQELVDEPVEEEPAVEEPAEEPTEESVIEETYEEVEEAPVTEEAKEEIVLAAIPIPTTDELGKTVRIKRSFECKIRQADDELKDYYTQVKNELLSYAKVKSNLSWNGDRFNFGRNTVARIGINGKTLCLYLAINPEDYSVTKYHHKSVDGVKAYEGTPMMLKVKSPMGLKKALSLVFEMMESLKARRIGRSQIDFKKEIEYKTDEEMLAMGLIKTSLTEKKDLNSF